MEKPASGGPVVWLTGLPASGKTTIAREVEKVLRGRGTPVLMLDSDELRDLLTPQATYDDRDRDRFYLVLAGLAALGARGGVTVIVSATAPKREHRDRARRQTQHFAEVFVACDRELCAKRDPKGLWARAKRGEVVNLPGAGAPYEEPLSPELVLDTAKLSARDAAAAVLAWIDAH